MRKVFLAFDLGASSGRGMLGIFENGRLELQEVHRFPNGPVERDGSFYWDYPALSEELRTGLRKALAIEPAIDGIGLDTWGVDYVLFDRTTGAMKRMPYNYRDHRTDAIPEKIWKTVPKTELYERTGIQYMQLNTLYQLAAHKAEHPEDFKNAILLPIPDALLRALGGDATAEYTFASTTNLLDPKQRQWDWTLIDKLGLPRDIFPAIVEPCTVGGKLTQALADEFGCARIPLYKIGSHDTASAVAAVPAPTDGNWAYVSCGTWALFGAEIAAPLRTPAAESAPFTNEGGLNHTIRFLTNIMGSWLIQETRRTWKEAGKNFSFDEMEKMALAEPPCKYLIDPCDGMFLAPGDMPARIREYCRTHGQGELPNDGAVLRAIYDSLALCFARNLRKLESILGVKYQALNMVGGGTKDGLLMQLTSDAAGVPVIAGPVEATAAGNLLGQAIAAGLLPDLAAAREVVKGSFELKRYQPNPHSPYAAKLQ